MHCTGHSKNMLMWIYFVTAADMHALHFQIVKPVWYLHKDYWGKTFASPVRCWELSGFSGLDFEWDSVLRAYFVGSCVMG